MDPATATLIAGGATVLTQGLAGYFGSSSAEKTAKIQAEENRRIEKLKIRFANQESGREMLRHKENLGEQRRSSMVRADIEREQLSQNESQFTRTHGLGLDKFKFDKSQTIFQNRMAIQNSIQNLVDKNHMLRFNLLDKKRSILQGK